MTTQTADQRLPHLDMMIEAPVYPSLPADSQVGSLESLLALSNGRFGPEDEELIRRAYELSREAHNDQKRLSGEPYHHHCVEVARLLMNLCPEPKSVAAALLHDTIEDTPVTLEQLQRDFPEPIALLVDGVTKLNRVDNQLSRREQKAESLRKMVLAMAKDIRVIIIKLCDRYHNMQTVDVLDRPRRERVARKTTDIYAPLAHMLGMAKLRAELEDMSMRVLHPEDYRDIARRVAKKRAQREELLNQTIKFLKVNLERRGIPAELYGRSKHFYSIYNKMLKQDCSFDEIYDLLALRIITKTVKDCYHALGVIHSLFKPIPGRLKDYIAVPKQNMYQSIHTSVIGIGGERMEIQIRTERMNQVAEEGVAAHWKYKLGGKFTETDFDHDLKWLRKFTETLPELHSHEVEKALKKDVFADSVFCFTPAGDVVELPQGSTPIDFAYNIHTKIGETTMGARINGKMVPLTRAIENGDTVEILTSKRAHPSASWLDAVVTSKAASKIRRWLRSQDYEQNLERGRDMLLQGLKGTRLGITDANLDDTMEAVIASTNFNNVEDLYAEIGFGSFQVARVVQRMQQLRRKDERKKRHVQRRPASQGVVVDGLEGTVVRLAGCCNPTPGDPILGFVTMGRGVSIHREDCKMMQRIRADENAETQARITDCHWAHESAPRQRYMLRIIGKDRTGLLADLSNLLKDMKIFILKSSSSSRDAETAHVRFVVLIERPEEIQQIIEKLTGLDGVLKVSSQRMA